MDGVGILSYPDSMLSSRTFAERLIMLQQPPAWWPTQATDSMSAMRTAAPVQMTRRWASVSHLRELAECVTDFLVGDLPFNPFCYDYRPAIETAPIVHHLVELNRLGLATDCSQPGLDRGDLRQRAYVSGLADLDLARHLDEQLVHTDLVAFIAPLLEPHESVDLWLDVPVTLLERSPVTWIGGRMAADDLFTGIAEETSLTAQDLAGYYSIQVMDPVWGRADYLWDTLTTAVNTPTLDGRSA